MGLLKTAARTAVVTHTATRVHQRAQAKQQGRWAQQAAAAPPPAPPEPIPAAVPAPPPPAAADPTGDLLDHLKRLGELRDAGVLTEEEFIAQKARLLRAP